MNATIATPAKRPLRAAIDDFLAQKCIAVAGVSRSEKTAPASLIYQKLKAAGHEVFAINPHATEIDGEACYPHLAALPHTPDALVIATPPDVALSIVETCASLGISRVWMHRSFGQGSVSEAATDFCREHGITVIAGACPMMYCPPVDFPHACMRGILKLTGGLPEMAPAPVKK